MSHVSDVKLKKNILSFNPTENIVCRNVILYNFRDNFFFSDVTLPCDIDFI